MDESGAVWRAREMTAAVRPLSIPVDVQLYVDRFRGVIRLIELPGEQPYKCLDDPDIQLESGNWGHFWLLSGGCDQQCGSTYLSYGFYLPGLCCHGGRFEQLINDSSDS